MGASRKILEVNLIGTARVLRAFETVLGHGSVACCLAPMLGRRVPESPERRPRPGPSTVRTVRRRPHPALGLGLDASPFDYPVCKRGRDAPGSETRPPASCRYRRDQLHPDEPPR